MKYIINKVLFKCIFELKLHLFIIFDYKGIPFYRWTQLDGLSAAFLILEACHRMLIRLHRRPWRPSEWEHRWIEESQGNPHLCWLCGRCIIWSWRLGVCLRRRGSPGLFLHLRRFHSLMIIVFSLFLLARWRGACGRACLQIYRTRWRPLGIQPERCVGLSLRLWGPLCS